jgi:hypothetical protein
MAVALAALGVMAVVFVGLALTPSQPGQTTTQYFGAYVTKTVTTTSNFTTTSVSMTTVVSTSTETTTSLINDPPEQSTACPTGQVAIGEGSDGSLTCVAPPGASANQYLVTNKTISGTPYYYVWNSTGLYAGGPGNAGGSDGTNATQVIDASFSRFSTGSVSVKITDGLYELGTHGIKVPAGLYNSISSDPGVAFTYSGSGDAISVDSAGFSSFSFGTITGPYSGRGIGLDVNPTTSITFPDGAGTKEEMNVISVANIYGFRYSVVQNFSADASIQKWNTFNIGTISVLDPVDGGGTNTFGFAVVSHGNPTHAESFFNTYNINEIEMGGLGHGGNTAIGVQDGDTVLPTQTDGRYPQYSTWRFQAEGMGGYGAGTGVGLKSYADNNAYYVKFGVIGSGFAMQFQSLSVWNNIYLEGAEAPAYWNNLYDGVYTPNLISGETVNYIYHCCGIWATPSLPTGTGSSNTVGNSYGVKMEVIQTGGAGIHYYDEYGTDITLVGDPSVFYLYPGTQVYFASAVPSSWTWIPLG